MLRTGDDDSHPMLRGCMRKPATLMLVALALGGCSVHQSRPVTSSARPAAGSPAPSYAATDNLASAVASDAASHGSQAFGRFVRSREPQLQFCYREALANSPDLAGSTTIAINLTDDGVVREAAIVRRSWSGKGAQVVEDCVLKTVRSWGFPAVDPKDPHIHSFSVIFTK
jgi:outer membrane biosynthesis protein TonB